MSSKFVLNMVDICKLQLRCHPLLFHSFQWFHIKDTMAHHPIIQKVVNELLAMGAIEPLTGDIGFYSNVFVVPKYTGGLGPMLNFKLFNCYMSIHTFKMSTVRQVWQLIQ